MHPPTHTHAYPHSVSGFQTLAFCSPFSPKRTHAVAKIRAFWLPFLLGTVLSLTVKLGVLFSWKGIPAWATAVFWDPEKQNYMSLC